MTDEQFWALLEEIGFPKESFSPLCRDYARLKACKETAALLDSALSAYTRAEKIDFYEICGKLRAAKDQTDVHPYASDLLFYLHLAPALRAFYAAEYDDPEEALFFGAMADLRCKLIECKTVVGVWGSFVACWFAGFYKFSLYTLGRLEFCLIPCPVDYEKDELRIKKGQTCIDVHIPSRGRLDRAQLDDAYEKAAAFFRREIDGPVLFHCQSWLLFKEHERMLPESGGIRTFMSDYDCIGAVPDEGDLWRIFGAADTGEPASLPEDTVLRRAYKARLLKGEPVGGGRGVFFYDQRSTKRNNGNKKEQTK